MAITKKTEEIFIRYIVPGENYKKIRMKERIDEIEKSLLTFGQLQPITVIKESKTQYRIIDGLTRYYAASEANRKIVEANKYLESEDKKFMPFEMLLAQVIDCGEDEKLSELIQMTINESVKQSPTEAAYKIAELVNSNKYTVKELSELLGLEYSYCSRLYRITKYNIPPLKAFLAGYDLYSYKDQYGNIYYDTDYKNLLSFDDPSNINHIRGFANNNMKNPSIGMVVDSLVKAINTIFDEDGKIIEKNRFDEFQAMIINLIAKKINNAAKINTTIERFFGNTNKEEKQPENDKKQKSIHNALVKKIMTLENEMNSEKMTEINKELEESRSKVFLVSKEDYTKLMTEK